MHKRILILFLLNAMFLSLFAQRDTEFWFVAPAVTRNHCGTCPGAAPVSFVFTTFDLPATVTITQPANPAFDSIVINIGANSVHREELWSDNFQIIPEELQMRKDVENWLDPTDLKMVLNKGIHIEATNYITAYYIVEEPNNSDIFALKGKNAIGREFYIPFQTNKENVDHSPEQAFSAIDIVAVEDGTEVWIFPTDSIRGWGSVDSFKIELDRGETYSIVPGTYAGAYNRAPDRRLAGTKIVAKSGKICVTIKDDSVRGDSGCYDLIGDQMIPVEAYYDNETKPIIGSDYIVMKGDLAGPTNLDRIYIVATEDNTDIRITDVLNSTFTDITLDEQEQYTYAIGQFDTVTFVHSDDINKPIYVLHVSGAGYGCEIGGAILPSVSLCTGSFTVGFMRDVPSGAKDFYLNVMARDNSLSYFTLNGNPIFTDTTKFIKISGTDWWAGSFPADTIDWSEPYVLKNSRDIFHLGTMHGGAGNGGNYGYFSNYAVVSAQSYVEGIIAQPNAKICYGDEKQLVASGGLSYEWIPSTYLDNPYIATPTCSPLASIKYEVVVRGASCAVPDTANIDIIVSEPIAASFNVEDPIGCAPFEAKFDNQSYGASKYRWYFTADTVQSYAKEPGSYIFENTTDTLIDYNVYLYAQNKICTKSFTRTLRVYPQINAGFTVDTFQGCDPLIVTFNDNSTGNLEKFFWEFGDGSGILDTLPTYLGNFSHEFTNRGSNDTTFSVWLVAESPFLCRDSVMQDITVHPYIDVSFGADTVTRCSPFTINVYNNSVGALSYNLDYGDGSDVNLGAGFNYILHTYINGSSSIRRDTMRLVGTSTQGCRDTFERLITIYPGINSQFSKSADEICDSSWIIFTDESNGYDFSYFWDFGDGNTSVQTSPSHLFRNTLPSDTNYIVSLKLESPYCTDISYDTVNVHQLVNAGYTYSIINECTPMLVRFDPTNTKGDSLFWDFDGDYSIDSMTLNHNVFDKIFVNSSPSGDIIYKIRLITSNYGCSDSLQRSLTIKPEVVSDIDNVSVTSGCSPIGITFGNLSLGGDLNYNWDFNDGTSSSDSIPALHNFYNTTKDNKQYKVKLTATHPVSLCSSEDSVILTIYPFVSAEFSQEISDICTPLNVDFTNSSTQITNENYEWDFGDGNTSTDFELAYIYQNNTTNTVYTYPVSLRAYNSVQPLCESFYYDTIIVYPKVVADFTPDINSGCNPVIANFSQNSNGYDLNYFWDYDDGTNSSLVTPTHTFTNVGLSDHIFDITLEVADTNNCIDDTTIQITVYPNVEAGFSLEKTESCTPFIVNLTNNSTEANNEIYQWDLGDGTPVTTTIDVIHEYQNTSQNTIENYPIQLRAYLSTHTECESFAYDTVTVYPEVVAIFAPDVYSGCHPLDVIFTENSNGYNIDHFWDFNNGTTSTQTNPTKTFENFNTTNRIFNVQLTVIDDQDCSDDTIIQITTNPYVNAAFSYQKLSECTPLYVEFDPDNSKANRFEWDFNGDGTDDETKTNKSVFNQLYNNTQPNSSVTLYPKLTSYYDFAPGCTDDTTVVLVIPPRIFASFTPDNIEGCQPFTVNFSNNSTGGTLYYSWDLGDSTSSSAFEPSHIYYNLTSTDKIVPITLTTTGGNACSDDTTITITVYSFIESDFQISEAAKCSPFALDITNSSRGGISGYSWDFDDGNTSSLQDPDHTYVNTSGFVNNYIISLIVNNIHGCTDYSDYEVTVYPQVATDFNVQTEGCHPHNAQFNNNTLYARDYTWYFGDGSSSVEEDPVHTFNNFDRIIDSIYTVRLVALSDYECESSLERQITVHPKPMALFDVNNSVDCPPFNVIFTNNSVGPQMNYNWNFGDGNSSNDENTTHIFYNTQKDIAEYDVVLITSTVNECKDTVSKQIRVYPEVKANFSADKKSGCSPLVINFTNLSENQDYTEWDFDNGLYSSVNNPEHRFVNIQDNDRKFGVKITSKSDYNCFSEYTDTITVYPSPSVEFSVEPTHQMYIPEPDIEITNWSDHLDTWEFTWDFGDGTTSNSSEKEFSKEYTIWGDANNDNEIPIVLTAVNSMHTECYAQKTHSIRIIPPVPEIEIAGKDPEGCVPYEVDFSTVYNYVHPNGFHWDFDDGSTSNETGPVHVFTKYGTYNVKLEVVGDGGRNYDYKTVTVHRSPVVDFVIEPNLVMLPAMNEPSEEIQCYNQSQYGETYRWDFGDGGTSTEKEPRYTYDPKAENHPSIPYEYDVKLTVWTEYGCVDSLVKDKAVTVDAAGVIKFPNAFTPNPDGPGNGTYDPFDPNNYVFHPYSDGVIEYHLEVYTRWGEVIFSTDNVNIGWDGYYKGQLVNQGVYIWKVWGRYTNNKEFVKWGDVTVLHNADQVGENE